MLKQTFSRPSLSSSPSHFLHLLPTTTDTTDKNISFQKSSSFSFPISVLNEGRENVSCFRSGARRRVAYDEAADNGDEEEEYGYNAEIAMLESYTQSARNEVLLVKATVDAQEVEVLIFKGFSSCLSYSTSPDPSRSVLPARAVIKSIDRVKGPFNPSNIEYIEKGLTWDTFKNLINPKLKDP